MPMPKNIKADEMLSKLCGVRVGTLISGLDITKGVWKYVKGHKLQVKGKK
jgi:hypothetical protein